MRWSLGHRGDPVSRSDSVGLAAVWADAARALSREGDNRSPLTPVPSAVQYSSACAELGRGPRLTEYRTYHGPVRIDKTDKTCSKDRQALRTVVLCR